MKKIYFIFLIAIINHQLIAQPRFSQFYSSPLLFNPANTGRFNQSYRIAGSFRSEKNAISIFNQSTFSFESKILNAIISENDCFAIGVTGLNERSPGERIKNDYLSISLAYQKGLDIDGKQQIGLGFQTTLGRKRIEPSSYFFESQLDAWIASGFTNIDISQITGVDVSYLDLNVGLVYQGMVNSRNFITAGVSVYHANKPNKNFQGGELILSRQFWNHFGWEKKLAGNRKIYSAALLSFSKKKIDDSFLGIIYEIDLSQKNKQLHFGSWFRKNLYRGSSLIPIVGLKYNNFLLNLSYGINISKKNTGQKGASEIAIVYTNATTRLRFNEKKFIRY